MWIFLRHCRAQPVCVAMWLDIYLDSSILFTSLFLSKLTILLCCTKQYYDELIRQFCFIYFENKKKKTCLNMFKLWWLALILRLNFFDKSSKILFILSPLHNNWMGHSNFLTSPVNSFAPSFIILSTLFNITSLKLPVYLHCAILLDTPFRQKWFLHQVRVKMERVMTMEVQKVEVVEWYWCHCQIEVME